MGTSRYTVSLRICHPSMDPAIISSALGLTPKHCWKAGDSRTTPRGTPLEGRNKNTYWTAHICEGDMPPRSFAKQLNEGLNNLVAHKEFLLKIREQGGRCEFFIGWFLGSMAGEVFSHSMLAKAGELGIDLSFDVYHDPELLDQDE